MYILVGFIYFSSTMYHRTLETQIKNDFFSGKIIMLLGARQIGKSTLVAEILKKYFADNIVFFNGDLNENKELLSHNSLNKLEPYVAEKDIIFIDEAQKIPNI